MKTCTLICNLTIPMITRTKLICKSILWRRLATFFYGAFFCQTLQSDRDRVITYCDTYWTTEHYIVCRFHTLCRTPTVSRETCILYYIHLFLYISTLSQHWSTPHENGLKPRFRYKIIPRKSIKALGQTQISIRLCFWNSLLIAKRIIALIDLYNIKSL